MPCYKPLKGWRNRKESKNGKFGIVFRKEEGTSKLQVPCGQCIGCRIDRSRDMATRIMHETSLSSDNIFITLTYNEKHLPVQGQLVKQHFQNFMKKIRHRYHGVRYYQVGEYGEENDRPHYHAILFRLDFEDKKEYTTNKHGDKIYTSATLDEIWGKGECWIGNATFQSAAYCARYIMKKVLGDAADEHYLRSCEYTGEIYWLEPEYATMSLKPGIGEAWYKQWKDDVFPTDEIIVDGKQIKVPKYYDKLLEIDDANEFNNIKDKRKNEIKKHLWNNTPERLAIREKIKESKLLQLKREL